MKVLFPFTAFKVSLITLHQSSPEDTELNPIPQAGMQHPLVKACEVSPLLNAQLLSSFLEAAINVSVRPKKHQYNAARPDKIHYHDIRIR